MKVSVALSLLLCSATSLSAQRVEDMPKVAMDTLEVGASNAQVVIYTNGTWDYHFPELDSLIAKDIYNTNWVTDQVFAYKGTSANDLPASMEFQLFSRVDDYKAPVVGRVSSQYGIRRGRNHNGVDISLKLRDPIYAAFPGRVRYSRYNSGGYGNLVIIRHDNGLETFYGHLSERMVEPNQWVEAGQVIGLGGSTGRSTGPHLHFETRYYGQSFDPERLIDFKSGTLSRETFLLKRSYFSIYSRAGQDFEDEIANEEQDKKEQEEREAMRYHKIRSGDTLGAIARKYGTTVNNICRLNGIKSTTVLRIGRTLRVR